MKTQIQKPVRTRASYTKEFQKEALEAWHNSGRSAAKVAAELGFTPALLYSKREPECLVGGKGGGV